MISGSKKMTASVRGLTSKEVLAPLLVLTLLVCHGLFVGLHQSVSLPALSTGGHPCHAEVPACEGKGVPHEGLGEMGYAATLLFVLTAVFWLLFKSGLERRGVPKPRLPLRKRYPLFALRYPRGPTASLLQVFRL